MDRHWETITFLFLLLAGGLLVRFLIEAAEFYRWLRNLRSTPQRPASGRLEESRRQSAHTVGAGRI